MARRGKTSSQKAWNARRVRALRRSLGLTQEALATELGVRQQTVSEWETGLYAPRGASATLLHIIAERAESRYQAGDAPPQDSPPHRGAS